MSDTAQQLWDQTDNYRREGGPGMPNDLEPTFESSLNTPSRHVGWGLLVRDEDGDPFWGDVSTSHAAAILRDHGMRQLVRWGFQATIYQTELSNKFVCAWTTMRGERDETDKYLTELEAINAAIGAVLAAKEGK